MPYITQSRREAIFGDSITDFKRDPQVAGELNFMFSLLIVGYVKNKGLNYQTCNDIVGALENCKDEFQRRIQHPYEDSKIKENGDVYGDITKLLVEDK